MSRPVRGSGTVRGAGIAVATVAALLVGLLGGAVPVQAGHDPGCDPNLQEIDIQEIDKCIPDLEIVPDLDPEVQVKPIDPSPSEIDPGTDTALFVTGIVQIEPTPGENVSVPGAGFNGPCEPYHKVNVDCRDNDPLGFDDEQKWRRVDLSGPAILCIYDAKYRVDVDGDGEWDFETNDGKTVDTC